MTYVTLLPGCRLVGSPHGAALYDAFGARLALLDAAQAEALRRAATEPLESWACPDERRLFARLQEDGFVLEEPEPAYVEPFHAHAPYAQAGIAAGPLRVREVALDIGAGCERRCTGCHASGASTAAAHVCWQGCLACVRAVDAPPAPWTARSLARVVDDVAALECPVLVLRGGDPLRDFVRVAAIREHVRRHPDLTLVVTTPGTHVDVERALALYAGGGFRLALVLHGAHSCDEQAPLVERLLAHRLPFHLVLLLDDATAARRDELAAALVARFGGLSGIAELRSTASLASRPFSHVASGAKPLVPWSEPGSLAYRAAFRPCLDGRLELGPDAAVRPCAAIDAPLATVIDGGLAAALAGDEPRRSWWTAAKPRAAHCRECALRLACTDCVAAERVADADACWSALCPGGASRPSNPPGFVVDVRMEAR